MLCRQETSYKFCVNIPKQPLESYEMLNIHKWAKICLLAWRLSQSQFLQTEIFSVLCTYQYMEFNTIKLS